MKPAELAQARGDWVAFADEMLASLPRSDQRRWGETYLRGLMLDGRRTSIEPMARASRAATRYVFSEPEAAPAAAEPDAQAMPTPEGGAESTPELQSEPAAAETVSTTVDAPVSSAAQAEPTTEPTTEGGDVAAEENPPGA